MFQKCSQLCYWQERLLTKHLPDKGCPIYETKIILWKKMTTCPLFSKESKIIHSLCHKNVFKLNTVFATLKDKFISDQRQNRKHVSSRRMKILGPITLSTVLHMLKTVTKLEAKQKLNLKDFLRERS